MSGRPSNPNIINPKNKYFIQSIPFLIKSPNPIKKANVQIAMNSANPEFKISGDKKIFITPKPTEANKKFDDLIWFS